MQRTKFVVKCSEDVVKEIKVHIEQDDDGVVLMADDMNIATLQDSGRLRLHSSCYTEGVEVNGSGVILTETD